jgi:hypothetical protein
VTSSDALRALAGNVPSGMTIMVVKDQCPGCVSMKQNVAAAIQAGLISPSELAYLPTSEWAKLPDDVKSGKLPAARVPTSFKISPTGQVSNSVVGSMLPAAIQAFVRGKN